MAVAAPPAALQTSGARHLVPAWPLVAPLRALVLAEAAVLAVAALLAGAARGALVAALAVARVVLRRGGLRALLYGAPGGVARAQSVPAPGTPPSADVDAGPERMRSADVGAELHARLEQLLGRLKVAPGTPTLAAPAVAVGRLAALSSDASANATPTAAAARLPAELERRRQRLRALEEEAAALLVASYPLGDVDD